jgi:hypothetical protein
MCVEVPAAAGRRGAKPVKFNSVQWGDFPPWISRQLPELCGDLRGFVGHAPIAAVQRARYGLLARYFREKTSQRCRRPTIELYTHWKLQGLGARLFVKGELARVRVTGTSRD